MGIAGSKKCYCREGFTQEAPLKGSLIEGAKSKDSLLDSDKGEVIQAEALQVKYVIMRQAVTSSPKVNLECMGKRLASLLDSGSMVSLVQQSYFDQISNPSWGQPENQRPTCIIYLTSREQMEVTSPL